MKHKRTFWVNTRNLTECKRWVLVEKNNAIFIKINLQKLVDVCIYKLSTNLQNFIQKDLTEVRYYKKFELGYFF